MQLMPGSDWMAPKSGVACWPIQERKRGISRDLLAVGIGNRLRLYGVLISLPSVRGVNYSFLQTFEIHLLCSVKCQVIYSVSYFHSPWSCMVHKSGRNALD